MQIMAEEKSQWMSIGQAASYLGISRDTLRRWEKAGKIKSVRSPTNRRYYTKKLLDRLMGADKEEKVPKERFWPTPIHQSLILVGILSSVIAVLIASAVIFFLLK